MKIGVTGGICCGKTTVCKYIETLGYQIFYSDIEAKKLVYDKQVKDEIICKFGNDAYINNIYNTKYIRDIVFNNKEKLNALNMIFKNIVIQNSTLD